MYPKISISGNQVSIKFSILDQFINAKPGGVKFGLDQIEAIDSGAHIFKQIGGLRAPGTYAFVLIGGTYWRSRKNREFWNARRKLANQTVRIVLKNHFYRSVVIQVPDVELLKKQLAPTLTKENP
jgi:hypothetical protein